MAAASRAVTLAICPADGASASSLERTEAHGHTKPNGAGLSLLDETPGMDTR